MQRDEGWLLDMILACRRILRYLEGVRADQFQGDEILQDAVVKRLEIIGEAANQVSADLRNAHPDIPWRLIIGMRHRLVHEYFHVDQERVWDVASREVPGLLEQLEPLVPPPEDASEELTTPE